VGGGQILWGGHLFCVEVFFGWTVCSVLVLVLWNGRRRRRNGRVTLLKGQRGGQSSKKDEYLEIHFFIFRS